MDNASNSSTKRTLDPSEENSNASQQGMQTVGSFIRGFFPNREQPLSLAKKSEATESVATNAYVGSQIDRMENKHPRLRGTSRMCKNTTIKGELTSEENLIVDGILEGPVKSEGDVIVSGKVNGNIDSAGKCSIAQGGEIVGNITCQNAEISGILHGNLHAECCVVLLDGAILEGDIIAASIRTAAKAQVHGHLDIGQTEEAEQSVEKSVRKLAAQNTDRQAAAAVLKDSHATV